MLNNTCQLNGNSSVMSNLTHSTNGFLLSKLCSYSLALKPCSELTDHITTWFELLMGSGIDTSFHILFFASCTHRQNHPSIFLCSYYLVLHYLPAVSLCQSCLLRPFRGVVYHTMQIVHSYNVLLKFTENFCSFVVRAIPY